MTESGPPPDDIDPRIDEVLAEEEEEDVEADSAAIGDAAGHGRPLAMDLSEANALAAERRPTVLVLAGAVGSGKTSVYAAIYERLGRGAFGGWMFAGSRTIPGLEQRCHWWRIESGGREPYMEHTRAEDLPWLHIRLRDTERRQPSWDLLFGDFDGEIFNQVLDGRRSARELPYLRRADHVGVVVDGGKIASATTRAAEKQQAHYLLNALTIPGGLASHRALSLIVTKIDLIEESGPEDHAEVERALDNINAEANRLTQDAVPLLRLAVRSHTTRFPLGHGLETLLEMLSLRPRLQIGERAPMYRPTSPLGRFRP